MDNVSLCSSLIKWLQAFPGLSDATTQSLSDGVQLANALHEIEPEFFSTVWLSKIKTDVGDNWRLKVSNLHKVYEGVVEFYTDQVGPTIQQFRAPDFKQIGDLSDENELGKLLQLILGCAINCKQKQQHIETIMGMEECTQTVIVKGIQDLMNREGSPPALGLTTDGPPSYHPQVKSLMEQLESTSIAKEEMDRRCIELDHQISMLVEERSHLQVDNEKLNERVDVLEKGGDFGSTRYIDLRKQVDGLQEELYKTESGRDEYRLRVDDLEKIVSEISTKNEELTFLADEARSLKDEVDTLRGVSDKVAEYETTIETFKRRQEEFSDLRRQVKILEEKNSNYMQNNLEMEEEVKKSAALRPQVDILRKQITDLHQKLADETKQKDKFEFDAKKLGDKLEAVTQEKDRIMIERFDLQKSIEELRCSVSADSASKSPSDLDDIDALEIVSPQIREKLMRLQHENRLLKRKAGERGGDSSPVFESMLNDLQLRFDRVQLENRWDSSYPAIGSDRKRHARWASESDLCVVRPPSNQYPQKGLTIPPNFSNPFPNTANNNINTNTNGHKQPIIIRHIHEFKMSPSPSNEDSGCCRTSPSSSEEYHRDSFLLDGHSPSDYLGTLDSGISGVCRCLSPLIPSIVEGCAGHRVSDIIPAARGANYVHHYCHTSQDAAASERSPAVARRPKSSSVCSESSGSSNYAEDFADAWRPDVMGASRVSGKLTPPSPTPHNSPRLPHSVHSYRSKSISRSVKISNLAANLEDSWSADRVPWKSQRSRSRSTADKGHDIPWNIDDARAVLACRTHLTLVTNDCNEAKRAPTLTAADVPGAGLVSKSVGGATSNTASGRNNPFGCSIKRRNPARTAAAPQSGSNRGRSPPDAAAGGETKSLEDVNETATKPPFVARPQRPHSFVGRSNHDPFVAHHAPSNVKLVSDSLFTHFIVARPSGGNRKNTMRRSHTLSPRGAQGRMRTQHSPLSGAESAPEYGDALRSVFETAHNLLETKLSTSAYGAPLVSAESIGGSSADHSDAPSDPSATEYCTDQASEEDFDPRRRFRLVDARPPLSVLRAKTSRSVDRQIQCSGRAHSTNERTCSAYYPAQPLVVRRQKAKRSSLNIKDKFSTMGKELGRNGKAIMIETFNAVCNLYTP